MLLVTPYLRTGQPHPAPAVRGGRPRRRGERAGSRQERRPPRPVGESGGLLAAARGRGPDLRVSAAGASCQGLPDRRRRGERGHREPGLPQPVHQRRAQCLPARSGLRRGARGEDPRRPRRREGDPAAPVAAAPLLEWLPETVGWLARRWL
ncbi:MAG: hypothetical protein RML12_01440 [Xanthomonadales bacterium]|nr:hypothetical protein [Xanthomonadales bacterium]